MNMNQKTRLKAEDMEWNVLETIRLSKEQLEADGSMERLLQGMETEVIPLKFRTPVIDLSMDATLRLVPGPGGNRSWKSRESARKRNRKHKTEEVGHVLRARRYGVHKKKKRI